MPERTVNTKAERLDMYTATLLIGWFRRFGEP